MITMLPIDCKMQKFNLQNPHLVQNKFVEFRVADAEVENLYWICVLFILLLHYVNH